MEFSIDNQDLKVYSNEFMDKFNRWYKKHVKEITKHIPDEYINNKFELNFINVDWPEHYIKKY